jgi:TatD DNase family protein
MIFVDTHTHLYLDEFDEDRQKVIAKALQKGVEYLLLPNIDSSTVDAMLHLCDDNPGHCYPMMGLHPGSVKENYEDEMKVVEEWLSKRRFYGIGEIGMDLYWDTSFAVQQQEVLKRQINLALDYDLPVVLHTRRAIDQVIDLIREYTGKGIKGVFHCFTGTPDQAGMITSMGFFLGIGGVVTFKNSTLTDVVRGIDLSHIILETDAPFLAPVPYRGKRNESGYIPIIAEKIANIKNVAIEEVARITTENALNLFGLSHPPRQGK